MDVNNASPGQYGFKKADNRFSCVDLLIKVWIFKSPMTGI